MKRKLLLTLMAGWVLGALQAQISNMGGTITVQAGATLVVEGDVTNLANGTISNSGTIEIKGNFTNDAANTTLSGTGVYKFTGSTPSIIESPVNAIHSLTIDKTSGNHVTLADPLTVNGVVEFGTEGNSNLILGANNLNLGTGATVTGAGPGGWIQANGTGSVIKNMSTPAAFTFPVGDAAAHMPLAFTPVTAAGAGSVGARIGDAALKPASITNNFTNDHWIISSPNYTGNYTGTYSGVTGSSTTIVGYSSTDMMTFSGAGTGNGSNTVTRNNVAAASPLYLTGYQFLKDFVLTAYLQGPLDSTNQTMSTALRTLGLGAAPTFFPTTCPYGTGATNNSIPTDVVDWVLVEVVDTTNSNTVLGSSSAFLRSNGLIVSNTSTSVGSTIPVSIAGLTQTTGSIRIKHRNHLSTRTIGLVWANESNPVTFNFTQGNRIFTMTSGLGTAPGAIHPQRPYAAGFRALWAGDVNGNAELKFSGSSNDRGPIYTLIGGVDVTLTVNGYYNEDVNLNNQVKFSGSGNDRGIIYQNIGGNDVTLTLKSHN